MLPVLIPVTLCYTVNPCYTVLLHVTPCYTVLLHVTPCYTVLLHVTPCYTVLHREQRVPKVQRETQVAGDAPETMGLMGTQELEVDKVTTVQKAKKEIQVEMAILVHRWGCDGVMVWQCDRVEESYYEWYWPQQCDQYRNGINFDVELALIQVWSCHG